MKKIEDSSIDLICIDPPYFEIMKKDWTGKSYDWDNQWKNFDEYLNWINVLRDEFKRILKDNGSLYIFADDKNSAYIQINFDKRFKLINNLIWIKPNNFSKKGWRNNRCYSPITERILFYSNDWDISSGKFISDKILEENLKPNNKFSKYLKSEFKRAGISLKEIAKLFPSKTGNLTGCVSNWINGNNIITKEQYLKIREYLNKTSNNEYLKKDYESLKKDYESLKKDYESLRRPFIQKNDYTDVWTHNITQTNEKTYHPTQKPLKLIKRIIETSSKEGDIVLDCFMGAGTTAVACKELKRNFIGFEKEKKYVDIAKKRLNQNKDVRKWFIQNSSIN